MISRIEVLLFLLLAVTVALASCAREVVYSSIPPTDNTTVIGGTGFNGGSYLSMALDSHDYPRMAYYDALNHALSYSEWSEKCVDLAETPVDDPDPCVQKDPNYYFKMDWWTLGSLVDIGSNYVGKYASLAIKGDDTPAISYYDETAGDLKYASYDALNKKWIIEKIDYLGNVGQWTSLAFESDKTIPDQTTPHIAYIDVTNKSLKYATMVSGNWVTATVDKTTNIDQRTSIAVYGAKVHIAYYDASAGDLRYQKGVISMASGLPEWIAENGTISATSATCPTCDNKKHGIVVDHYDTDSKSSGPIDIDPKAQVLSDGVDVGKWASLALNSDGDPMIAYYDDTNGDLKFAGWSDSLFAIKLIDSEGLVGAYTTIDIDSSGNPGIAYFDSSNYNLKFAKLTGTTWEIKLLDVAASVGYWASFKFSNKSDIVPSYLDTAQVAYYDSYNKRIKFIGIAAATHPTDN